MTDLGVPLHRKSFWDADHIIAVHDGGGLCGLDRYRTLCIVTCHPLITAKQRSKWKKQP